jgi:YD repeat-containing protein
VDYGYDAYGNVTRVAQQGDPALAGDEATVTRQYVYNSTAWIMDRVKTESLLDGSGVVQRQTRTAYDGQAWGSAPIAGLPTQVSAGNGSLWAATTTAYDAWGNPTVVTDTLGRAAAIQYDSLYHQYPTATTNPLAQTTRTQWDVRLGVPLVITDANGAATRLGYDSFGRLTSVTRPGESLPAVKYTYPSPLAGGVGGGWVITAEVRAGPTSYQKTWTVLDGLGRVIQTQAQAENGWLVVQSTAYNGLNRPVTVTLPYTLAAAGGAYLTPNWATLPATVTRYDALGRVTQVIAPDGATTTHAYRDRRELVLDANGHQTETEQDGLGRLLAVREYYGTYATPDWNAAFQAAETRYWYNSAGNLIAVRDPLSNTTRMAYDPLGRKTTMDDPSMGRWTYRYDAAGNLVEQTDALGQRLEFVYDALDVRPVYPKSKEGG